MFRPPQTSLGKGATCLLVSSGRMYETADTAPGWFYLVALAVFPASMVLSWLVSRFASLDAPRESVEKWIWGLPIAGGVATGALLLYGANKWG